MYLSAFGKSLLNPLEFIVLIARWGEMIVFLLWSNIKQLIEIRILLQWQCCVAVVTGNAFWLRILPEFLVQVAHEIHESCQQSHDNTFILSADVRGLHAGPNYLNPCNNQPGALHRLKHWSMITAICSLAIPRFCWSSCSCNALEQVSFQPREFRQKVMLHEHTRIRFCNVSYNKVNEPSCGYNLQAIY